MPVTAHPVVSLAKTTRPSRAGIIPRERLYALLDEARGSAAAWITGPPGCGKTTVAASYLEHRKLPALWYQLDEGDADVASFFYYLDAATNELARRKTPRYPSHPRRNAAQWKGRPGSGRPGSTTRTSHCRVPSGGHARRRRSGRSPRTNSGT